MFRSVEQLEGDGIGWLIAGIAEMDEPLAIDHFVLDATYQVTHNAVANQEAVGICRA